MTGVPVSAESDAFLTVAEIAEILKLNQQTVRNWI
jgi:DNA-binding CsgD family transcriptional regulator